MFKCNQEKQIIGNEHVLTSAPMGGREGGRETYCRGAGKGCEILGLYGMTNKNSKASISHRALAVEYSVWEPQEASLCW